MTGHTELDVGNGQRGLLLILELLKNLCQERSDLSLNDGSSLLNGSGGAVELLEVLQFEAVRRGSAFW